jgi:hypothetical protein
MLEKIPMEKRLVVLTAVIVVFLIMLAFWAGLVSLNPSQKTIPIEHYASGLATLDEANENANNALDALCPQACEGIGMQWKGKSGYFPEKTGQGYAVSQLECTCQATSPNCISFRFPSAFELCW